MVARKSCDAAIPNNDGANFIAERWPPWRQGVEYDAGLLFIAYQRDPRTGFIKIFDKMAKMDALNQFTTHNGSGMFAIPPGARRRIYRAGVIYHNLTLHFIITSPTFH